MGPAPPFPLDRAECEDYINAHMQYAGCTQNIFTDSTIDRIYQISNGVPRMVNRVCEKSLMYASQTQKMISGGDNPYDVHDAKLSRSATAHESRSATAHESSSMTAHEISNTQCPSTIGSFAWRHRTVATQSRLLVYSYFRICLFFLYGAWPQCV